MNAQLAELERLQDAGETVAEMTGDRARSAVADLLKIDLPESAANIFFARQGTTRPAYWLRFSLDRRDVEPFLARVCPEIPTDDAEPSFQYALAPDILVNLTWWRPETTANPAGGHCDWRDDVEFRLLLDRPATGQQTVYIEITGLSANQDD